MSIKERIKQTTQLIALNEQLIRRSKELLISVEKQLKLKK